MTNLMLDVLILPTQSPNPEPTEQPTEQPTDQPEATSTIVLQPIGTPASSDEFAKEEKHASNTISPYVWVIGAVVAAAAVAAVLLTVLSKKKKN